MTKTDKKKEEDNSPKVEDKTQKKEENNSLKEESHITSEISLMVGLFLYVFSPT